MNPMDVDMIVIRVKRRGVTVRIIVIVWASSELAAPLT